MAAIGDGQSIAEVAQDNGVAVSTVVDAMIAEAQSAIDQAVEDGRLTQDQADEKKADLSDRVTSIVNGETPLGGGWGHGWLAPSSGDEADATST